MDQSLGGKKMNDVPSLPIEIIFQILLCLPCEFLYECGRFVCKEWASIICSPSFIKAHEVNSKGGLLFQNSAQRYQANFLNLENWETTQLRLPFQGIPLASCRGICLFLRQSGFGFNISSCRRHVFYVVNLVTRQFQVLPSPGEGFYRFLHIVYVEQLGQFKVVCHFTQSRSSWLVFTLGIDMSWRKIDVTHSDSDFQSVINPYSTAVGKYIFLPRGGGNILAINLCDESFRFVRCPRGCPSSFYYLRKLGDNLSCIHNFKRELHMWILSDLETHEWVRVSDIEDVVVNKKINILLCNPVGLLDNSRIFVFEIRRRPISTIVAYNAETGTKHVFDSGTEVPLSCVIHSNSLVKW
ncbi:hypothetical protein M9H77_33401 [Catharanthus roseus]|uniref:Uncharacterized protein n=1 Tax=Catharanthus roseus TaxID=4058 RepID=A0ACB9ZKP4_CATRO|nr:hypothetical protein M9H77_33401 [Catharanthus roseus]